MTWEPIVFKQINQANLQTLKPRWTHCDAEIFLQAWVCVWLHHDDFENQIQCHLNFYPLWASQLLYTCGPWQSCLQENVVHKGPSRLSSLRSVYMYLLHHHMLAFRGAFPHKGAKFSIDVDFTFRPGLKHFWKLLESLVWLVRDSPIILAFIKLYKLCRFSKWPLLLISLFLISTKIDYFSGESKQLADPDVLKRLTSSVRFVSFSQVWTSTAVVLSVKCPHKISYRRHFYFWDNNWCPSSTYWLFPENLAQLSCFFFVWHKGLAALPWTRQRRLWPACAPSLLCNSLTPAGKQTINKRKLLLEWLTSFWIWVN